MGELYNEKLRSSINKIFAEVKDEDLASYVSEITSYM